MDRAWVTSPLGFQSAVLKLKIGCIVPCRMYWLTFVACLKRLLKELQFLTFPSFPSTRGCRLAKTWACWHCNAYMAVDLKCLAYSKLQIQMYRECIDKVHLLYTGLFHSSKQYRHKRETSQIVLLTNKGLRLTKPTAGAAGCLVYKSLIHVTAPDRLSAPTCQKK